MNQSINHSTSKNADQLATTSSFWKRLPELMACLIFLAVLVGCASTEVVNRKRLVNEQLPRPSKIFVYDFIANPADVPKDSSFIALDTAKKSPAMTSDDIKVGRKLGASIARQLAQQIRGIGISTERAPSNSKPKLNDIVLRGYLVSLSQGSGIKRVVIGFGFGASELQTVVEGYQMTDKGLRKLGAAELKSVGSKTPGGGLGALSFIINANPIGLIVGGVVKGYGEVSGDSKVEGLGKRTAKEIADLLKVRFKEEGWIK